MRSTNFPLLAVILLLAWHHAPISPDAEVLVWLILGVIVIGIVALVLLALVETWRDQYPRAVWCLTLVGAVVVNQRFADFGSTYGFIVFFDLAVLWLLLEWLPPWPKWWPYGNSG